MTSTTRDSNGRFGAGHNANPAGRPRLTEAEIATRECLKVIDQTTPLLLAKAFERIEHLGETDLMGPALNVLAEILKARNLDAEQRMRDERLALAELCTGAVTH